MKITCGLCTKEKNKKCSITKSYVKLNKKRRCTGYEFDVEKDIAVLERRARVQDRNDHILEARLEAMEKFKTTAPESEEKENDVVMDNLNAFKTTVANSTNSHPVTGDLSRFKTGDR